MCQEGTLGDEEQAEDDYACIAKDNNIRMSTLDVDMLKQNKREFSYPKFMTNYTPQKTLLKYELSCPCPSILVADDDVFNLFTIESLLNTFGVKIAKVNNGQEAIDAIKSRYHQKCSKRCQMFRLVLMDLSMPVMDGFEATVRLRELISNNFIPDVPIVACTAFVDTDKMEKCLEFGMRDRISKPISKNKIQRVLQSFNIPYSSEQNIV